MNSITSIKALPHHPLSCSNESWEYCGQSVWISRGIPDKPEPAALSGTAAHMVAELCLRGDIRAEKYIGDHIKGVLIDQDMAARVQHYINRVKGLRVTAPRSLFYVEQEIDLDEYIPQGKGTCDCCIYYPDAHVLHLLDFKDGILPVQPGEQLKRYALGFHSALTSGGHQVDHIILEICQPRDTYEPKILELSEAELLAYGEHLKERVLIALDPNCEFNPGPKQCRYCKGRAVCPALTEKTLQLVAVESNPSTLKEYNTLSVAQKQKLFPHLNLIQKWCEVAADNITAEVDQGDYEVPGYKMIEGRRGARRLKPGVEDTAKLWLKKKRYKNSDIHKNDLKSPTQLDSVLTEKHKTEFHNKFVEQAPGKHTLVPKSHRSPAIEPGDTLLDLNPIEDSDNA